MRVIILIFSTDYQQYYYAIAFLVSCSHCRLGDGLSAQTEVEALGVMGFKSDYQISQSLTVTEQTEHQCKKLVPTGGGVETLHNARPLAHD